MGRKLLILKLKFCTLFGKNHKKAEIIRKSKIFKKFGRGNYWHPDNIPSHPNLISIGDNVTVATNVRLIEHDLIRRMWNGDENYIGPKVPYYVGEIEIGNNTSIGANSIILYGVKIGKNCVIAAGSVVVKDVEDFSIVGGNPARVIGNTKNLLKKRLQNVIPAYEFNSFEYDKYFKEQDNEK